MDIDPINDDLTAVTNYCAINFNPYNMFHHVYDWATNTLNITLHNNVIIHDEVIQVTESDVTNQIAHADTDIHGTGVNQGANTYHVTR